MNHQTILILDYGSQTTQLIARRIREAGVYCEIHPCTLDPAEVRAMEPTGLILSGGPMSVYDDGAPQLDPSLLELRQPGLVEPDAVERDRDLPDLVEQFPEAGAVAVGTVAPGSSRVTTAAACQPEAQAVVAQPGWSFPVVTLLAIDGFASLDDGTAAGGAIGLGGGDDRHQPERRGRQECSRLLHRDSPVAARLPVRSPAATSLSRRPVRAK